MSKQGKVLVELRNVAQATLQFGTEKNDDDKLQDLIYDTIQIKGPPIGLDLDASAASTTFDSLRAGVSELKEQVPTPWHLSAQRRSKFYTLTLSQDLIERLIIDILEITELLTGPDNVLAVTSQATETQVLHHPDKTHGRPDKDNFGDTEVEGGQAQAGFSRRC